MSGAGLRWILGNIAGHGVRTRLRGMEAAISTEFSGTPALIPFNVVVVLLVLAALILLVTAVHLLRVRHRERREEERELPPLVYAPSRRTEQRPTPLVPADTEADAQQPPSTTIEYGDQVLFDSTVPPVRIVREPPSAPIVPQPFDKRQSPHTSPTPPTTDQEPADADVTLQLLPGRLEPADPGNKQEIRFIRVPGSNRFTLGRDRSAARTHIQLNAATASRMHAFMLFEDGQWHVGNMSQTNPVVVNGTALNGEAPRPLTDGDRIEFGELTFVFRER